MNNILRCYVQGLAEVNAWTNFPQNMADCHEELADALNIPRLVLAQLLYGLSFPIY
jgi:hypothetical protein